MEKVSWKIEKNCIQAAAVAANKISELLQEDLQQKVLLLLSGGSAFEVLKFIKVQNFSNVTVGMLDERFDKTNENNNFSQLEKTDFFVDAQKAGAKFFESKILQNDTLTKLKTRMENDYAKWFKNNPKGKIVALFGIGSDGHTAGIMPFPEDEQKFQKLFAGEELFVAYDAGTKNSFPQRVTTTLTFHEKIDNALVFACGKEKKEVLIALKSAKEKIHIMPAMIFFKMRNVEIITAN